MGTIYAFEDYLRSIDLRELLEKLEVSNIDIIVKEVKHFTEREAERRDQIVSNYFGEEGVRRITESIVKRLLYPPLLRPEAKILDVGAGSGFFTIKVMEEIHRSMPDVRFYAMDVTPTMLSILAKKTSKITPFLGVAENIVGGVEHAQGYLEVPRKFDALFSTLMLHHCTDVKKAFMSFREVLEDHGRVVVIDLCEHPFEEFREEMGDIHLGFDPIIIEEQAREFFSNVNVERMKGICCESSGRSAELFITHGFI